MLTYCTDRLKKILHRDRNTHTQEDEHVSISHVVSFRECEATTHRHIHSLVPFNVLTVFLTVRWATTAAVWWLVSGEWNSLLESRRASEVQSEWERQWTREGHGGKEGGHMNGEKDSEVISSSYVLKVERCWRKDRKIFFCLVSKQKKWKEKKDPHDSVDWHLKSLLYGYR